MACGVHITDDNCQESQDIVVYAALDSPLQDGDQTGQLTLSAMFYESQMSNYTLMVPDVQVSFARFSFFIPLLCFRLVTT